VRPRRAAVVTARPLNASVRPLGATTAQTTAALINATPALKSGSLRFWGEWFGRPNDNIHRIAHCEAIGNVLVVTFDDGGKLEVTDPDGPTIDANTFQIRGASSVRWQWYYYGRSQTPGNLYYYEFKRSGSEIESTTNVDWYKPTLSPRVKDNACEIL